MLKVTGLMSLT